MFKCFFPSAQDPTVGYLVVQQGPSQFNESSQLQLMQGNWQIGEHLRQEHAQQHLMLEPPYTIAINPALATRLNQAQLTGKTYYHPNTPRYHAGTLVVQKCRRAPSDSILLGCSTQKMHQALPHYLHWLNTALVVPQQVDNYSNYNHRSSSSSVLDLLAAQARDKSFSRLKKAIRAHPCLAADLQMLLLPTTGEFYLMDLDYCGTTTTNATTSNTTTTVVVVQKCLRHLKHLKQERMNAVWVQLERILLESAGLSVDTAIQSSSAADLVIVPQEFTAASTLEELIRDPQNDDDDDVAVVEGRCQEPDTCFLLVPSKNKHDNATQQQVVYLLAPMVSLGQLQQDWRLGQQLVANFSQPHVMLGPPRALPITTESLALRLNDIVRNKSNNNNNTTATPFRKGVNVVVVPRRPIPVDALVVDCPNNKHNPNSLLAQYQHMLESLTNDTPAFLAHVRQKSFSKLAKAVSAGVHSFRMILTRYSGEIYVDLSVLPDGRRRRNSNGTADGDECLQTLRELKDRKLPVVLDHIRAAE